MKTKKESLFILGLSIRRYIVPKINQIPTEETNNKKLYKNIRIKLANLKNKFFNTQLITTNIKKNFLIIRLYVIKHLPTFQQISQFIVIFIVIILLTSRKVVAYDKLEKNITENIVKKNITNLLKNTGGKPLDQILLLNLLKTYNEQQSQKGTEALLRIAKAREIINRGNKTLYYMLQLENLSAAGGIFFNSLSMNPAFQKSKSARLKCHAISLLLNILSIFFNRGS